METVRVKGVGNLHGNLKLGTLVREELLKAT